MNIRELSGTNLILRLIRVLWSTNKDHTAFGPCVIYETLNRYYFIQYVDWKPVFQLDRIASSCLPRGITGNGSRSGTTGTRLDSSSRCTDDGSSYRGSCRACQRCIVICLVVLHPHPLHPSLSEMSTILLPTISSSSMKWLRSWPDLVAVM